MLPWPEMVSRLLLAAILGGIIGFEREKHMLVAGLRTHMLVCLGAAVAMIVSTYGFYDILGKAAGMVDGRPDVVLDPSRIAAQVISGIGFLGAGTIMFLQRENVIRGLTTAAGLWTVAAIGLAAGGGMYYTAVAATGIAWIVLTWVKFLEKRLVGGKAVPSIQILSQRGLSLVEVEAILHTVKLEAEDVETHHDTERNIETVILHFPVGTKRAAAVRAADALKIMEGVSSTEITGWASPRRMAQE